MLEKEHSILPFFKISLSYTIFYLCILVLIPLSHLVFRSSFLSLEEFISILTNPRVIASCKLTFTIAFIAATINVLLGLLISWTIVRYDFLGKQYLEMLIDLPLALPTAIAGLTLATVYAPDMLIGKYLSKIGIQVAFTNFGVIVALIFVGLPLAVRTIEPVIREFDIEVELAAANLGANKRQIFLKIHLPSFLPSIFSAFSMCFARALSEYGAVIFISSNIPKESEIISLLIFSKIEQFDYNQATAIALIMLVSSFMILWSINVLSRKLSP